MQRVLVIDDDSRITSLLKRGLAFEGFVVDTAPSGPQGLTIARDYPPDLVILDVMMPGMDGFEVLRRLRSAIVELPVLLLTARDAPVDQVEGLEAGADDYVAKPFTFSVLAARVRALLRRSDSDHPDVLHFESLTLDTGTRQARRGERDIRLTATEYEVLRQFLLHPRRVLPKHMLLERIWGCGFEGGSNVLEVYVKQLRRKLESDGESRLIHTFRGAGYVLRHS